jgi:hypothetical protein
MRRKSGGSLGIVTHLKFHGSFLMGRQELISGYNIYSIHIVLFVVFNIFFPKRGI